MAEKTDNADPNVTREMPPVPSSNGDSLQSKPSSQALSGSGRLEVRCPNCHTPTEVAVDTSLTDLTCGSCGSHFSLVDQSKATRMAPSLSKLGRFELIERLGVGGFGSVWKARDKELDRTVAIKIPREGGMTPEEQEKFFREARAAAQLRHPGIVSVFEVGRDGESIYIVSEFVRGVTLGDWLTGQQITSREAATLCAKIAVALEHAHEQGVVHRDLKPANIMMDYDGEPHLMDFGLARREAGEVTMTMAGQILGTPAYMSPEQAEGAGHMADRRSDVYSLGVVLFQLLTGELPFRGNARMLIKQMVHDEPPSPRKLNSNVSKDLETITLKCLEKQPEKRYATAAALAADLRHVLAREPIEARPISRIARAWRWGKRKPALAALAALLVLIGVAGPIVALRESKMRLDAEANEARATQLADDEAQARERAERATREAEKQRQIATQYAEQNLRQVVGMNVLQGDSLLQRGDPAGALPWYVEALRLDKGDAARERPHRLRLAAVWQNLPRLTQLWREPASASYMQLSPDGHRIAACWDNGTARVYDMKTGQAVSPPLKHETSLWSCAFSNDGKRLTTASGAIVFNSEIRTWEIESGKDVSPPIKSGTTCFYVAYTGRGDLLSAEVNISGEGMVRLRNGEGDKEIASARAWPRSPENREQSLLIDAPRGRMFQFENKIGKVISLTDGGKSVCELPLQDARFSKFSSDGTRLLTVEWNEAQVWDVASGKKLASVLNPTCESRGVFYTPKDASFSLNNEHVTLAGDRYVWQINVREGTMETLVTVSEQRGLRHFVSRDGRYVALAAGDGTVRVWDVQVGGMVGSPLKHGSGVNQAIFSEDGQYLVTACGDGCVRVWDVGMAGFASGRRGFNGILTELKSTGEDHIAAGRNWVHRIKPDGGTSSEFTVPGPWPDSSTLHVAGELYATGSNDGQAQVWNYASGKAVSPKIKHDRKHVVNLAISPDKQLLATASVNEINGNFGEFFGEQADIWRIDSGQRVLGPITVPGIGYSGILSFEFSPDGKYFAYGGGGLSVTGISPELKVIDLKTLQPIQQTFELQSGAAVTQLAFDPSGRYLIAASGSPIRHGAGEMRIWDLKTGRQVGEAHRFPADITSFLTVDAKSPFVAAAVADRVYLFNLQNGESAIAPLTHDRAVNATRFSQSGDYLFTASEDNFVRVWDVATGRQVGPRLGHPGRVAAMELLSDGRLATTAGNHVFYFKLVPLDRSLDDIARMGRLASTQEIAGRESARTVPAETLQADWEHLRRTFPDDFNTNPARQVWWHYAQISRCWNSDYIWAAVPHYEDLVRQNPNYTPERNNLGTALCESGDPARGAAAFGQAAAINPNEFYYWYHCAAAQLQAGNITGYKATCKKILEKFEKTDSPDVAADAAKICLIGPNEFAKGSLPFELADRAMAKAEGNPHAKWYRLSKALAEYRAGNFHDSGVMLEKMLQNNDRAEIMASARYLLAMAYWRQDDKRAARVTLGNTKSYYAKHPIEGEIGLWLARALVAPLQQEAEKLVEPEKLKEPVANENNKKTPDDVGRVRLVQLFKTSVAGVTAAVEVARQLDASKTPQDPADCLELGEALILGGESKRGAELIRIAISQGGRDPWYHKSLGWALLSHGKSDDAAKAFRAGLGVEKFDEKDNKVGIDQWVCAYFLDLVQEQAFAERWRHDEKQGEAFACFPYFYIGQRHEIRGEKAEAIKAYERAVELGEVPKAHWIRNWAEYRLKVLHDAQVSQ